MSAAPEVAATPLSKRLQEGTREAHERVERTASFNRLIVVRIPAPAPGADARERERAERARAEYREVYRRFLVAAHGFEAAVDRALAASPALDEARRRGYADEGGDSPALVRADLARVFGAGAEAAAAAAVMDDLPPPRTVAELAGLEYVRRGSRAGGAVIAAVVHANLGWTREEGASFLARHGRQTRGVIVAFKDWVDGLALPGPEAGRAVAAAVDTFLAVERWHLALEERFERG